MLSIELAEHLPQRLPLRIAERERKTRRSRKRRRRRTMRSRLVWRPGEKPSKTQWLEMLKKREEGRGKMLKERKMFSQRDGECVSPVPPGPSSIITRLQERAHSTNLLPLLPHPRLMQLRKMGFKSWSSGLRSWRHN